MILSYLVNFKWGQATRFETKILDKIKIHSLRENEKQRWRVGMSIQHAHGMRTAAYRCFKNDSNCTALQQVFIYNNRNKGKGICMMYENGARRFLVVEEQIQFALNDGFDTLEDFFRFFNKDKYLTIVHWTEFYNTGFYATPDPGKFETHKHAFKEFEVNTPTVS